MKANEFPPLFGRYRIPFKHSEIRFTLTHYNNNSSEISNYWILPYNSKYTCYASLISALTNYKEMQKRDSDFILLNMAFFAGCETEGKYESNYDFIIPELEGK